MNTAVQTSSVNSEKAKALQAALAQIECGWVRASRSRTSR